MKLSHAIALITLSAGLVACANKPVDNTPLNPASVLKADYALNGVFVPDFHGKQTVYTQADKRRIDLKTEADSFLMSFMNMNTSDVARIDKKLVWNIDHDQESYRECALSGCADMSFMDRMKANGPQDDQEESEDYESYEEMGCSVKMSKNDVEIKKTGKQRVISGFDAQEFTLQWQTEFKDDAGKKDTNLVQFVFWTTEPTEKMQSAWKINRAFQEAYAKEKSADPLMQLLGKEGYMAIAAFSGDVEKTDKEKYNGFTKELSKIEGYPLSIKLEWFRESNACQKQRPAKKQALDFSNGVQGAALGMASSFLQDQRDKMVADWMKDALVRYIYEVTYVSEEMVRDSTFNIPHGYKIADRQ
ncbi:MAG: hypothetical protein H7A01_01890 [Hahellaceae bacterium]|nr:hypothetical protein [Hahellaceae bacterium]MCP5212605.1 hypothetical protein [Hahellaceae bacterium]